MVSGPLRLDRLPKLNGIPDLLGLRGEWVESLTWPGKGDGHIPC